VSLEEAKLMVISVSELGCVRWAGPGAAEGKGSQSG
jgi:hypothetical protein